MQNTVNLNLKKPDQNDFVNIGDINDNMDILDVEVAKKYVKPLAGIPSLDLDSATQAALKKAETALQTVTKSSVGLGNVDNTSDVNKPVSTAQQVALDKKANLASPSLTGTPTAPTAAESTNTQQIATTAFVDRAVKTHQADNVSHDTYVTCATASATAEKVVTANGFTLVEGARITVKFANANTATTPTLKINAELAKPLVKADGTAFKNIKAGIYSFVYSGSNFTVQGEGGEYGNVTAADVRSTKTFGTENGVVQGTLNLSQLIPDNIKKGVTIDGVVGNVDITSLGGKKWASGTAVFSNTERKRFQGLYNVLELPFVQISNLNFTPKHIALFGSYKGSSQDVIYETHYRQASDGIFNDIVVMSDTNFSGSATTLRANREDCYINSNGFLLPVNSSPKNYGWVAFE